MCLFLMPLDLIREELEVEDKELLAVKLALEECLQPAPLVGGGGTPLPGLDRPQEPVLYPRGKTTEPVASKVGTVL